MNHLKVKICGITRVTDAIAAVDAGADALGFMFYEPSPRFVRHAVAAEIIRELPPFVAKVGVFVDASEGEVRRAMEECGLDTLQFHGAEPPEFCGRFGLKAIKAFRMRGPETLATLHDHAAHAWLLDSYVPGAPGGTGATFNWDLAREATRRSRMVLLAGGLTPENVAEAIRHVRPYGVDVSSGVESAPGRKDAQKIRAFVASAKTALG